MEGLGKEKGAIGGAQEGRRGRDSRRVRVRQRLHRGPCLMVPHMIYPKGRGSSLETEQQSKSYVN